MTRPSRCEFCSGPPGWRLERYGDAVVTWACNEHLAAVAHMLQRPERQTMLTLTVVVLP